MLRPFLFNSSLKLDRPGSLRGVVAAEDGGTAGVRRHLGDPGKRFFLPLPVEAEAGSDALLPVAGGVGCVRGQEHEAPAVSYQHGGLAVGMAGEVYKL